MKRNRLIASIALSLAAAFFGGAATADEVELRAITFGPPSSVEDSTTFFRMWMDKVNAAGKGLVQIKYIGGPEVFPPNDQINALSKGLIDITMVFTVHRALVPEIDTTGLSDITPEEERKVGYIDLLDKAHEKINVKVIGRTATNSGFFIFSKDPIRKLADFQGLRIRSHTGYDPLFKAVGAIPIGISIADIYSALERGVVRAAPYPLFVYDMGLQDVAKYVLADNFWVSHTTFTFMNRKKFDSLSPAAQKLLIDKQLEMEKEMPKVEEQLKAKEQARLEKVGMVFVHLAPDEAKRWRRLANDTRFAALRSHIDPATFTKIQEMIVRQ